MYVVTVEFVVARAHVDAFRGEMIANARASRATEYGCQQFDVCHAPEDRALVFLYEVYDDERAFEAHSASAHYLTFAERTKSWVERKTVRTFERLDPR